MQRTGRVFGHLTAIFSSVSLLILIKNGFEIAISAPVAAILEAYQELVHLGLGWLEPWVHTWISELNALMGWHLHLDPQWRYVFILMWVYFMSFTKVWAGEWEKDVGWSESSTRIPQWIPYMLSSLAVSLAIGMGSGLIGIKPVSTGWLSDLLLVGIVGLGIVVFWEMWSWRLP